MRLVLDGRIVIPRMTGAGRYVIELARRLPGVSDDIKVELLLLPAMGDTSIPSMLSDAGVTIRYVNVRIATLTQWIAIPRVLRGLRPDLYHYPFFDLPYVACPSVVTIYDLNPILHREYFDRFRALKRAAAHALMRSTLRRTRAAFAISESTRRLVGQHYPRLAHKVRTIRLGVDPAVWNGDVGDEISDSVLQREAAILWRTRPYILYVGVDRPHKNLVRLVRAFGAFRGRNSWQKGAGPYLWLLGVGMGSPELRAKVSQEGLEDDVRMDRGREEHVLRKAYREARAVAYVSTSEGFGLPILEAFAAKVPVVAASASSLPEVGGDAVVYAPPEDERAISEALFRVWTDEKLRQSVVSRGVQRLKEFSWDATARATATAYYEALRSGTTNETA